MKPLEPLDVAASLHLQVEDEDVHIYGDGARIVVALPGLRAGSLLTKSSPSTTSRRNQLMLINQWLQRAGLTVDILLAGAPWARIGAEARPGALARRLRLGDLNVRTGPSLQALVKHRPFLSGLALGLESLVAITFILRRIK